MTVTVIHIRDQKKTDPKYIFGGRPGQLGNPFIIGRDGTRDEVCDKYAAWAQTQPKVMAAIAKIKPDTVLGCFCKPLRCHCDWIAEQVNTREEKSA